MENQTNILESIYEQYRQKKNEYETTLTKIEQKIARLENKRNKLKYPHWTDYQIRPVMEEIKKQTPEISWEDMDRLIPMGLRCSVGVFGKTTDDITVGIVFTPGENDTLNYDSGEYKCRYPIDTLGDLNGFNNIVKPVDSIETLIVFLNKNIEVERNKKK